jgi:histidine triad (HIT) family protein
MSLAGEYDGANIFAKILRGEMPCVKIFEDENVLAFMDIFPQSQGHCLVIPKNTTARNLIEFPADRLGGLFAAVQKLSKAVVKALNCDGVIVTQFNGRASRADRVPPPRPRHPPLRQPARCNRITAARRQT